MKFKQKINWLALENEIREILMDDDFDPNDALICIDECLARHTGRGNSRKYFDENRRKEYENKYPKYFDWGNWE